MAHPRPASVLIVDSPSPSRDLLAQGFQDGGFDVRTASSRRAALRACGDRRPDLVVTETQLPDANDVAIVQELRACCKGARVVVVTAHGSIADAYAAGRLGATNYLAKPVTVQDLVPRIPEAERRPSPSPSSILIVDGSAVECDKLMRGFRDRGLAIQVAASCRVAAALLRERLHDLVVSDLRFPDGSGLALLRELREISALPRFVVVTSHRSIATVVRAMQLGASNYLVKPATAEQILADPGDADLRNSVPRAVGAVQHSARLPPMLSWTPAPER